jgi:hypothetical protein
LNVGLLPYPAGEFAWDGIASCTFDMSSPQCQEYFADGGCTDVATEPVVAGAPLGATQGQISSWLNNNGPEGGTPTKVALENGYAIMQNLAADGERYVLLITDGEPTTAAPPMGPFPAMNVPCGQLADIEAAALAAAQGTPAVKTFVIGSPGSEGAGQFLSTVAQNGQTAKSPACSPAASDCHYQIGQANFEADLQAALDAIAGAVQDCVFKIPEGTEEVDPGKVNVVVATSAGDESVYKDTSHADGWDYTDGTMTAIRLYGPACEAYQAEEGAAVSIVLGCETIVK